MGTEANGDSDSVELSELTESFGDYLKKQRAATGKSLEEIARTTRISKRYLEAFEENRIRDFPETAFAKGFLRNYAQEIGLDSEECLSRYDQLMRAQMPTQIRDLKRNTASSHLLNLGAKSSKNWSLGISLAVGGLVLLTVLWMIGSKLFQAGPDLAEREVLRPGVVEVEEFRVDEERSLVAARPSSLELRADTRLTLIVRLDESASQEIMISPGETKVFEVFRQVELQGVDQGGLELTYNGQPLEVAGSSVKLFNRFLFD